MSFRHPSYAGVIGVTRQDVTPPVGIRHKNWAASTHDVADGVSEPLMATAMAIIDDDGPLVLVAVDLGSWRAKEDEWFVRGYLLQELGLPESRLIIALSHTHAGPTLSLFDAALPGGYRVRPYLERLRLSLLAIILDAIRVAEPATLDWTYGVCDLATNRFVPAPDGKRLLVGFNPDVTADHTLLVGRVHSKVVDATIVNYACHPTSMGPENTEISPDFVGAMRSIVEDDDLTLFLQGASGDLAPRVQFEYEEAASTNGTVLGYAVLAARTGMLRRRREFRCDHTLESASPLAIYAPKPFEPSRVIGATLLSVELELRELPPIELIEAEIAATSDRTKCERLLRQRLVRRNVGDGPVYALPVWLWRVGDALFVGTPAEPFSLFQTALREAFPDFVVVVMNVANGCLGYLPTRDMADEDVVQTPFASGSLERLIDAVQEALRTL